MQRHAPCFFECQRDNFLTLDSHSIKVRSIRKLRLGHESGVIIVGPSKCQPKMITVDLASLEIG